MSDEMDPPDRPAHICPHGVPWLVCPDPVCVQKMCDDEDAATCPHGFLVGCPVCMAALKLEPREKRSGWIQSPPASGQWELTDDVEMRRRELYELEGLTCS